MAVEEPDGAAVRLFSSVTRHPVAAGAAARVSPRRRCTHGLTLPLTPP
jgi:hypothetical protein